ncbi:GNAT family N-acetyltransferase [Metabacillus sp. HB246100]
MVNIRLANVNDAEEIVLLKKEIVYSTEYYLRTPKEKQEESGDYEKKIIQRQKGGGLVIVAVKNNKVIGFLSFSRPQYRRLNHTGSFGMGIKQEFRNMGIGTRLLSYLIEWATAQEGLEKICLEVFSNNESGIYLYERLGFKVEGKQANQIKLENDTYADLLLMSLFL